MVNNLQIFDIKLCLLFNLAEKTSQRGSKWTNTSNLAESGIKSAPDVAHNHVMSAIILVSQKTSEVMENFASSENPDKSEKS